MAGISRVGESTRVQANPAGLLSWLLSSRSAGKSCRIVIDGRPSRAHARLDMTRLRRLGRASGWLIAAIWLLTGAALTLPALLPWHHPLVSRAAVVARTREAVGPSATIATKYVQGSDLRDVGVAYSGTGGPGFWVVLSSSDKLSIDPCGYSACTGGPSLMYLSDDQSGLDRIGSGPTADPTGFAKLPDRAFAEWLPSSGSWWWGTVLTIAGGLLAAWMFVTRSLRPPAAIAATSAATSGTG